MTEAPVQRTSAPGAAPPHRPARGELRRRVRWPRVILDLADVASAGSQAVAEASIRAARPLLAADAALVVRWQDGQPIVLAANGDVEVPLDRRPPEGSSWAAGRPVAAVSVDPRTDVVVARSAPIAFEDSDLQSLRALAQMINWATGERTPDALLRAFATRVVASLEPAEVLLATADAVARLLRADIAGLLLCDESGEHLEMSCAIGNTKLDTARLRIRAGQGLAGRVLQSGRPERIDDYSTDPRSAPEFMALSDIEGTCAAIAVPLRWDGRISGVLCAWRRRREPFTDDDENLFASFAELCGAAIHNADRHEVERSRGQRLQGTLDALQERHRGAERDLHVHAELTRIAIDGGDVEAVVRTVSDLTGSVAVVVTDDGRVLGSSARASVTRLAADVERARLGERTPRQELPGEQLPGQELPGERTPAEGLPGERLLGNGQTPVVLRQDDGSWILLAQVRAAGVTFGHLALGLRAKPTAGDKLAAGQAAVVCALLLAREEAAVSAARRLQSEFVWDLLDGRLPDSVEAGVRARHLGSGFVLPARVVAITVRGLAYQASGRNWNPEHLERARSACSRVISQALDVGGMCGSVLARRADLFAVLVPSGPAEGASDGAAGSVAAGGRLAAALATVPWPDGMGASIGIGGPVERVAGFPEGWREAQLARSAAAGSGEPGVFEDLGVLQFLLAPTSREDLDSFARRQLGTLLDYDTKRGTELTRTLDVYLAAGCSTRRTAELMCIHHRTVSYRLKRVGELTGLCLDDQEDRFRVQLACKILALSAPQAEPTGPARGN